VHVVGASFGGLIAQSFALRYPERTATLTLIGSSFKVGNRHGEVNRLSIVAAEDFDRITGHDPAGRLAAERPELERLLLRCESMDPRLGLSYLDVFAAQPTLLARLPDISVPTLVVHGRHDTVIPLKTAHLLHGSIPDVTYTELPGAGHFPCLTHAEEVHAVLLPFLAAHSEQPTAARRVTDA
jgi:pimeloyl-ACP methyl ester carboxylesterase